MEYGVARQRKSGFWRKFTDILSAATFILIVTGVAAYFGKLGESDHFGSFRVIDGDSLELGGYRFRLEGIDAPETRQLCVREDIHWKCGRKSTEYLRQLMKSKRVHCRGHGLDKYERTLVRCTSGKVDINAEMVRNGWAVAFGNYYSLEREAKLNKIGIWEGYFVRPQVWREQNGEKIELNSIHDGAGYIGSKLVLWWTKIVEWLDFS